MGPTSSPGVGALYPVSNVSRIQTLTESVASAGAVARVGSWEARRVAQPGRPDPPRLDKTRAMGRALTSRYAEPETHRPGL